LIGGTSVDSGDVVPIDFLELGEAINLLLSLPILIEDERQKPCVLSPYAPTDDSVGPSIVSILTAILDRFSKKHGKQPIHYEPGCGDGRVSVEVAQNSSAYVVCLELDETLLRTGMKRRRHWLVDYVIGDLATFKPRRVDTVYAYLLPSAVRTVLDVVEPSVLLSLDYPATRNDPRECAEVKVAEYRTVYVYAVNKKQVSHTLRGSLLQ